MGQRQDKLREIINNFIEIESQPRPTTSEILNSKYSDNISLIYLGLTGQLNEPPTRFGFWDISTKRFIIELDEERHFNRYRLTTLNSSFYESNHYFLLMIINHIVLKKKMLVQKLHVGEKIGKILLQKNSFFKVTKKVY